MDKNVKEIVKKINLITYINYAITIIFLILIFIFKDNQNRIANRFISTIVFVGATLFSVALPILFRTGYYQKSLKNKGLDISEYFNFKLFINISIFIGSFFALYGYYYPIYKYHLYFSIFVCIWGIYSIFPSSKVIEKDLITYKVKTEE